jgi:hypothetical protein
MELDQKIRYGMFALTVLSFVLAGLGAHGALHSPLHLRALEGGGNAD